MAKPKTSLLKNKLSNLKIDSALFVENKDIDKNFLLAAKNVPKIDIFTFSRIKRLRYLEERLFDFFIKRSYWYSREVH